MVGYFFIIMFYHNVGESSFGIFSFALAISPQVDVLNAKMH